METGYKDAVEMERQRERWGETRGEIGVEEIRKGVRMCGSITALRQTSHKQYFCAVRLNCLAFPSFFGLHFLTKCVCMGAPYELMCVG